MQSHCQERRRHEGIGGLPLLHWGNAGADEVPFCDVGQLDLLT